MQTVNSNFAIAINADAEPEHAMVEVLRNWRKVGLKFSAADEEFLERSRKEFGKDQDWPRKEESSGGPNPLKPAAAVEKQETSGTYGRKAKELKRKAMVLKRRSDLLHLVLSYPMKTERAKQSQPCLGSYFSIISQKIKQLESLLFDKSSSSVAAAAAPGELADIIIAIQKLFDKVEKSLGEFDFEITPYLEAVPIDEQFENTPPPPVTLKIAAGFAVRRILEIFECRCCSVPIVEQSESAPPPSPVMHKLAINFAVRQILEFFEGRKSGKIGISGSSWEVLKALKDVPNITNMFDFIQTASLDQRQSMLQLHVDVLRQVYTKSNEGSARFLLLVDSIDEEIDLDYLNNLEACIVFPTRPKRTNEMLEVDLEIRMEDHLLPWNLFCKNAGRVPLSTTNFKQKVEHFIEESHGHLLAIILLTKASQNEMDPSIWNLVIRDQQLTGTTVHDQVDAMMINVLRFIWDRFDSTTKNCVKYFIAHKREEEKEITKDSLIGLWISSGWIEKSEEGLLVFEKLINYFFLEDAGRGHFRMREETKLWLLNTFALGHCLQYLEEGALDLTEPLDAKKWNANEIHLVDNKISELPESPNCSILVKLYLQCNYNLMVIPSSFFNCMPVLHILDLSFTSIKSLPGSISKLVPLRKFFLRGCDLLRKLPPEIGALKRLEEFDLDGTYLMYLPKEIGKLVNLTHLKVCLSGSANLYKEHNSIDTIIPRKVLSNLHQLKELSIDVLPDGDWWDVEVRAIISEVSSLSCLEELKLYLPVAVALEEVGLYKALKKFRLIIGCRKQWFISRLPREVEEEFNNSEKFAKGLMCINGEGKPMEKITEVLKDANAFSLERHWTMKNLSEFGHENMKKLEFCCLVECNEIQTIIDVEDAWDLDDRIVLDELKYLSVHYMKTMESLCKLSCGMGLVIMPHLKSLALHTCPSLNTVFTLAMLRNLVNLKEVMVEDCPNISSLVTLEDSTREDSFLPNLEKISLLLLPKLVSVSSGMCIAPKLKKMIIFHCPKLQVLSSTEVSSKDLKVIKADREWWTALRWHESDRSSGRQDYLESKFIPLDMNGDLKDDDEEQPRRLTGSGLNFDMELSPSETGAYNGRWELMENILSDWREAGRKLSAADKEFFRRILKETKCNDKVGSTIRGWLSETESGKAPANPLKTVAAAAAEAAATAAEAAKTVAAAAAALKAEEAKVEIFQARRLNNIFLFFSPAKKKRLEDRRQQAIYESELLKSEAAAAEAVKKRLEERRLKTEELRRNATVLKRRSDLLHLILSYPMKTETSKQSLPCLGSYFSTINQKIKQLENLTFDESLSSAAAPGEGDDIINTIQQLSDEVEKNLGEFDFEIAPYLEKQPLKAAAADMEEGSGSTSTQHVNVVVDNSTLMPATIVDQQSENAPPPSPVMHKLAIDFAIRQILEFFEGRKYGKIGISGSSWEVLRALIDAPSIRLMFNFIQKVSLDQHQSMIELHLYVSRQVHAKSNEDSVRFLLLVDSIDQDIDLDYLNNLEACIVFPTRPQRANEVLEVDLEIRMEDHLLPWNLFCKNAGTVPLSTTTFQQKVEHFIEESRGHLLAIILLTKALQNEMDASIWNLVIRDQQLTGTTVHDQVDAMMINVLRFIWDRLDSTTKNCVKYFIAHKREKEKEITKDSLIGLWISSGWIEKSEEGLLVFEKLINYFFLEDAGRGHFRMREETKLWLLNTFAPGHRLQYLEEGALDLTEPLDTKKWNANEIHLVDNKISKLPENPNCSILVKLYLQCNYDLMVIPLSFFNCMPVLHILDLSFTSIKSLPESISKLVPLRKFFLRGCDLLRKLPPEIGALKRLEEFDLEGTYLLHLPKEVGELVNLTHLKVCLSGSANLYKEHNDVDTIIPRKALSNLHQLKELSIDVLPDGDWWDVEVRAIISEVSSLSCLEELKLYLPVAMAVEEVELYKALKKFRLIIGCRKQWFISRLPREVEDEFNNSEKFAKGLKYINGEGKPMEKITEVLKDANAFSLERHWTVKNLSEFGHENMKRLEFCCLVECNEIQTIIDSEDARDFDDRIVLDELKYLSVHYMKRMESLCKLSAGMGLVIMPHLKSLALHTCPSLITVFTLAMLRNLENLKEVMVEDCPNISSLVTLEDSTVEDSFLPNLEKISLLLLPKLVSVSSGMCIAPKLKKMVIFHCPKLQILSSTEVSSKDLKVIKADREWWTALRWHESDRSCGRQDYLESKFIPLDMNGDLKGIWLQPDQMQNLNHNFCTSGAIPQPPLGCMAVETNP